LKHLSAKTAMLINTARLNFTTHAKFLHFSIGGTRELLIGAAWENTAQHKSAIQVSAVLTAIAIKIYF